jgi:hypothetical protein
MIAGKHSISEEKPAPDGGVRQVKRRFGRGMRKYGEIHRQRTAPGQPRRSVYWAPRKTDDKLVADQAWTVPTATVDELRNYGVTHIGLVVEDGTLLLAPFDLFGRAGLEQGVTKRRIKEELWIVPEALFEVARPAAEVREATMLDVMQIKGNRAK